MLGRVFHARGSATNVTKLLLDVASLTLNGRRTSIVELGRLTGTEEAVAGRLLRGLTT